VHRRVRRRATLRVACQGGAVGPVFVIARGGIAMTLTVAMMLLSAGGSFPFLQQR